MSANVMCPVCRQWGWFALSNDTTEYEVCKACRDSASERAIRDAEAEMEFEVQKILRVCARAKRNPAPSQ